MTLPLQKANYRKPEKNHLLRTWNGRYAGMGILYDKYDDDESGIVPNKRVHVRFEGEKTVEDFEREGYSYKEALKKFDEYVASRSGPVTTYFLPDKKQK